MSNQEDEPRFERKFLIEGACLPEVEARVKINPGFFREVYYERAINNIYLDTPTRRFYFENVDGHTNRTKARIRWYGEMTGFVGRPILEFKIKDGMLGHKRFHPLPGFNLCENFSNKDLRKLMADGNLPPGVDQHMQFLEGALINRYRRRYYLSADNLYRITIDFDLQFYNIYPNGNFFLSRYPHPGKMVLELKYSRSHHREAERVASALPYRLTRMSKYVVGMDSLSGI
jgi:hypothetical protein